jgi:hypothetical protein
MAPSSIVHQANEDQTHSSMMARRVHEFGPPNVMRFERALRPTPGPSEVLVGEYLILGGLAATA